MRRSALVVLLLACRSTPHDVDGEEVLPTATVTCAPTKSVDVEDRVEVVGVIAPPPSRDATISSPIPGRIGRVLVEEGDRVKAGALLATIEDPALPAGAAEARANVAGARAAKVAADQELARQQRLVAAGIGARRDLDVARAGAAAADAALDAATARSGVASSNDARRELRAPHAGVVLHLWKRAGESVDGTSATPIVEVADLTTLEVRAQLSSEAVTRIRDGMPAVVRVPGIPAALTATVARVAPAVEPTTLLVGVRIEIEGTPLLTVGTSVTATITSGTHRGVLVPASALRRSMVGVDEVVACEKGVARVRAVEARVRDDGAIEILKGLAPGEQLVTDHVLGLEDGQALANKAQTP